MARHPSGAAGTRAALVAFCAVLSSARGASDSLPHYHTGKLDPYEIGPPSMLLSRGDEEKLAAGEALMQAVLREDGVSRRLLMVKDIHAPDDIITSRILDLDHYPQMVKGCDKLSTYEQRELPNGQKVIKACYEIHALHMRFKYYMEHTYDPAQRCMVFRLDYDRRSDLDDSVGYWYVQPKSATECRVFYSCDSKLRQWVPGPVYNLLTKQALKQTTSWVNDESLKEWAKEKVRRERSAASGGGIGGVFDGFRVRMEEMKMGVPHIAPPEMPHGMRRFFERGGEKGSEKVGAVPPAEDEGEEEEDMGTHDAADEQPDARVSKQLDAKSGSGYSETSRVGGCGRLALLPRRRLPARLFGKRVFG